MTRRPPVGVVVLSIALVACSHAEPAPVAAPSPSVAQTPPGPLPVMREERLKGPLTASSLQRGLEVWRRWAPTTQPSMTFDTRNPVGEELAMLVTDRRTDDVGTGWVQILLPIRPNEATGWVRASDVQLRPVQNRILVDLSERSLRHLQDGKLVDRFEVGVGQPQTPTATGTFYIWEHAPQASATGPYGIFALGLSGFSEVLTDWPGGGRMAIHGTAVASDRGQMVSHGCVRVFNPDMEKLMKLPLGTPVIIRQ
ncbi:MAG: L,D-transpeptidase [Actinobacteria bacterium]|nr:L,D-transpeptidase [Actinomycetota bacterium]